MTKRILVVSDLHVGSVVSLMPDEVEVEPSDEQRAQRIQANPLQKVIYKEWCEMIDTVGRVDACFDLGDNVDGPNKKSNGFELWTSNLHQQVVTAADLLGMVKTNSYFGVQGSYYHVSENTSADLAVLNSLKHCRQEFGTDLAVTVDKVRVHLSHAIGYTRSQASKCTAPKNEIDAALRQKAKVGKFNLLMRGHRHEIADIIDHENNIRLVVCPGWKARDAFAAKNGLAMVPTLGWVLLKIDGKDIVVDPYTFELHGKHLFKEVSL